MIEDLDEELWMSATRPAAATVMLCNQTGTCCCRYTVPVKFALQPPQRIQYWFARIFTSSSLQYNNYNGHEVL